MYCITATAVLVSYNDTTLYKYIKANPANELNFLFLQYTKQVNVQKLLQMCTTTFAFSSISRLKIKILLQYKFEDNFTSTLWLFNMLFNPPNLFKCSF